MTVPADTSHPRGTAHPLAPEVGRVAAAVRDAVREAGEPEAAAAIDAEVARSAGAEALVVVVGEKKRGKSSLINALMGHPGLLPTAADLATGVHIDLAYAAEPSASVHYAPTADATGRSHPVGLDEVGAYAAVDAGTRRPRHPGVGHVSVGVPSPLLRTGLCLVDTPGVGGLAAGHTAITLASLNQADALVFVTSGQNELTASELAFLAEATQRIGTVLFVLAQTDKFSAWREILTRNQELLRRHAPRYATAPWFPVSARHQLLAADEVAAGRDAIAAKRRERGGFAPLESALVGIARRADAVRLGNVLHVAGQAAGRLAEEQQRRIRALALDPTLADEVRKAQREIEALQSQNASWRPDLADRLSHVQFTCRRTLARQMTDLRDDIERRINDGKSDILDRIAADLPARLQGLWLDVERTCREGLTDVVEELTRKIGTVGVDPTAFVPTPPDRLHQLPSGMRSAGDRSAWERVVLGLSAGSGVRMVGEVLLGPIGGIVLGGVAAVVLTMRQGSAASLQAARADARRFAQNVFQRVDSEVGATIEDALRQARMTLQRATEEALRTERARLNRTLEEQRQIAQTARETLEARRADAARRLERLATLRAQAAHLSARLADSPAAPHTP